MQKYISALQVLKKHVYFKILKQIVPEALLSVPDPLRPCSEDGEEKTEEAKGRRR